MQKRLHRKVILAIALAGLITTAPHFAEAAPLWMVEAGLAEANYIADRFEAARRSVGMLAVADIERCYEIPIDDTRIFRE